MKIKICGLRRAEDIEAANACMPDYIGYILCGRFRRYVAPERAEELSRLLDPEITPVGVFVDQSSAEILKAAERGTIRMIQLHGSETEEQIRELKRESGLSVVKAVKAEGREAVLRWLDSEADFLLFDSGTGTGRTFDWNNLAGISRPFFLAGGLTPENIPEAVRSVWETGARGLCAVDISSGTETDGWKDAGKMERAVIAARGIHGSTESPLSGMQERKIQNPVIA